ncbi:competence type IV pilus assembly protein ComGB [Halobacillus sp. B23F22_1]|uniref:competence type IV pilus assembly protein ComGB n=1 Tax=Halobacillus sp. B23F22_1 TaxID=3459514 RepID=UPI00373E1734
MLSAISKIKHSLSNNSPSLPLKKQITFLNRLCKLLTKGYPLLKALKMTSWDDNYKKITQDIIDELNVGNPLDEAFKKANFSKQVSSFLYFARIHKDLPSMFRQCAEILQLHHDSKKKLQEAIRYPIILLIFLTIAFTVIKQTILPSFSTLFATNTIQPWSLTILKLTDLAISSMGFIVIFVIGLSIVFYLTNQKLTTFHRLLMYEKTPLVRSYKMFTLTFLFSTHLSSLLKAGLPLKEALQVISHQTKYLELAAYGKRIENLLQEGQTLAASVHSCTLFRPELTSIFHHTNDLETLESELQMLSELLIEQLKEKMLKIVQYIQPVFFIGVACIVVLIYASIMLPLYQWMDQI